MTGATEGPAPDRWAYRGRELPVLASFSVANIVVHSNRLIATYRTLELGGGPFEVGIVAGAFAVLAIVGAIPVGRRIDRVGERPFVISGAVMMAAATVMAAAAPHVGVLVLAQALLGLGHVGIAIGTQSMVARARNAAHRDRRFAGSAVAASAGQLFGPALAGFALTRLTLGGDWAPSTRSFAVMTVVAVCVIGLAVVTPRRPARAVVADHGSGSRLQLDVLRRIFRQPGMTTAISASVAVLTAVDILVAYLPVIGESRGFTPGLVGAMLSVRGFASLVSRAGIPLMLRTIGRRLGLFACMVSSAAGMVVTAFVPYVPVMFLAMIVMGFGMGVGGPLTTSWVAGRSSADTRATALSLRLMGNRLGQMTIPAALGALAAALGAPAILVVTALSLIGASLWVRTADLDG